MIKIGHIEFPTAPVILAPMESITDSSYRSVCKSLGADLMYTEFIASEGLIRNARKSLNKLILSDEERPIGIQIFGHDIDSMVAATRIAEKANPDLIDLNFGCPVRKVVSKGSGAALLKDIPKMLKMTQAVVNATVLPVTVKTRLGWDESNKCIADLAERLQDTGIKALTIHARTAIHMYRGRADWTLIGEVKNNPKIQIPIIGNGDIDSPQKAQEVIKTYHVDGIMIGRAATGNPWLFRDIKHYLTTGELLSPPEISERIRVCSIHLNKSIELKGEKRGVLEMRKFYGNYFKGLLDFKLFKMALVKTDNYGDIINLFDEILEKYGK
ncbi:MAG: tRNA dihydrouridine synthase DusB [Bacteroidetes bacterium]|nr:tRNA dihydrouridine synthase DusB [Bacteroidota bacterium]